MMLWSFEVGTSYNWRHCWWLSEPASSFSSLWENVFYFWSHGYFHKFRSLTNDCQENILNYRSRSLTVPLLVSIGEERLSYLPLKGLPPDLGHTGRAGIVWYSFLCPGHLLCPVPFSCSKFTKGRWSSDCSVRPSFSILLSWQLPSSQKSWSSIDPFQHCG